MSEFLEASTNLPLIDVAGNWAVFERRISPREVEFSEEQPAPPPWPARPFIPGAMMRCPFPPETVRPTATPGRHGTENRLANPATRRSRQ